MYRDQSKLLFFASLGGILEFYDFIIYALFANYIAKAFFTANNALAGLMISFATFAIGYLVRPLGGIFFGHFGDRIGRKKIFTISILIMALSTLGIGIVPSYDHIGIAAPLMIISFRILQGMSIGGEIPGALTYVSEFMPKQRGFACGIIFCALTMGIVLGSLTQAIVMSVFSTSAMQVYGWRIPFIVGGLFGLISCVFRRQLHESPQFIAIQNQIEKFPIITVCKKHGIRVVAGGFVIALCAAIITALLLFTPSYFDQILHYPINSHIWQFTAAIFCGSLLSIIFGWMVDRVNIKKLLIILCLMTGFMAYPIFIIYVSYPEFYFLGFIISAILMGFSAGVAPCLLTELFPTAIRYTGIGVSYNLGFAIFGGLTPFISLSLINYTGWLTAPALYLVIVSILALLACAYSKYCSLAT